MLAHNHPLQSILNDIEKALNANLWFLALSVTLTLPDICSLLECGPDESWAKREKYVAWFDKHGPNYSFVNGVDCWALRGGVIHKGHFEHHQRRYDRIMFTGIPPVGIVIGESLMTNTGGIPGAALGLNLPQFCKGMIESVKRWAIENESNPVVAQNLNGLVRLRPEGFSPYYVGLPVIT